MGFIDISLSVPFQFIGQRRFQLIREPMARFDPKIIRIRSNVMANHGTEVFVNIHGFFVGVSILIDEGVVILEYSGHGGTETWADEGIFRIENAPSLRNQHLPFIVTTTCLNGPFDKPREFGQRSLSEQFMIGRYGAIGTLSATRLTLATSNAEFDEDLFKSIFTIKPPTLGAIIADAKIKFLTRSRPLWISDVEQYTLFGDPATRLALPDLEIKIDLTNFGD